MDKSKEIIKDNTESSSIPDNLSIVEILESRNPEDIDKVLSNLVLTKEQFCKFLSLLTNISVVTRANYAKNHPFTEDPEEIKMNNEWYQEFKAVKAQHEGLGLQTLPTDRVERPEEEYRRRIKEIAATVDISGW
jgi:hypothetical protein